MSREPHYLGDAVDITEDGVYLTLTANRGGGAEGRVMLDHGTLAGVLKFAMSQRFVEPEDLAALAEVGRRDLL